MALRSFVLFLFTLTLPLTVNAQVFDSLYEYGNAADSNDTSGAGIERGATYDGAGNVYTITAGGTDIWSNSDHGSAIFDSTADDVTGNFSAVVKVQIGLEGESMPGEWGRSGIMARTDPTDAASAYFATTQKFDGPNQHILQARDSQGAGTGRPSNGSATNLITGPRAAADGVEPVPVWLALHRYNGTIAATWAPDEDGTPGTWSSADGTSRAGSDAHNGPVQLGLFHQNHNVQPEISTATFTDFSAGDFDNSLGEFPLDITRSDSVDNTLLKNAEGNVMGTFYGVEMGGGDRQAVDWKVELLGDETVIPGLFARSYLRGNNGNSFDPNAEDVNASGQLENIQWWGNANPPPAGIEKYPDVFNLPADTNSDGDNQENYSIDLEGEIFIPEPGTYQFKDGVDDYTLLQIDGETLIDDNTWTNPDGTSNGGSPIVEKTFDAEGWYSFHMQTAEGGGGDAGVLYWDYDNDEFPDSNTDAAGLDAIVPPENFRSRAFEVQDMISNTSVQEGVLMGSGGETVAWEAGSMARVTVNGVPNLVTIAGLGIAVGDYNEDGFIDVEDVDLQSAEMKKDPADQDLAKFDHNGDNVVDVDDRITWIQDLRVTWAGDSNDDNEFNSGDLVKVFTDGLYETGEMAGWGNGDWDGNMMFDSSDLVFAFTDGGYELGPRNGVNAVPEPTSCLALVLGFIAIAVARRRRR